MTFNYVEVYSLSNQRFYHKRILNFVKFFFWIYWNYIIFILHFVNVVYHTDWFDSRRLGACKEVMADQLET